MTISFLGPDVTPTLSTPSMIMEMEQTARLLLQPFLGDGEASVGASVMVRHLAPTPLGRHLRATATFVAREGRRCLFDVACYDDHEKVGEGQHERYVITVARFKPRIDAKLPR